MVDKNSALKNNFFDNVAQGVDQMPAFLSNTLTRTTEIPFEAVSDIVVEPILRFLVPGTSEEERQKIIADIAAKDKTQAAFLEGARGRIQNILQLPSKSREQLLAIKQLEDDMVAIGYPKTTVMNVLNKGREFFFGPQYDIHKKVADGEIRPSELEGQDIADYFLGFVDVADVVGISSGVVSTIRKALTKQDFGALKNIINTLPPEKVEEVSNRLANLNTPEARAKNIESNRITKNKKRREEFQGAFKNLKKYIKDNNIQEGSMTSNQLSEGLGFQRRKTSRLFLEEVEENLEKGIYTQEELDFVNKYFAGKSAGAVTVQSRQKLINLKNDLLNNAELQNKGADFYVKNYDLPSSTIYQATSKDPELYALVVNPNEYRGVGTPTSDSLIRDTSSASTIREVLGVPVNNVDIAIIQNFERGTSKATGLEPQQFFSLFKKTFGENFKNNPDYIKIYKQYEKLETERLALQKEGQEFFDQIFSNPQYNKYLKSSDRKQFMFQKAHAFSIADVTGQNRMANMAQMPDLIFNAPVGTNIRVQEALDTPIRNIAQLANDNKKFLELAETPVNMASAQIKRKFNLNIPNIIDVLKKNGIEINPDNFKNLQDLIYNENGGIATSIDQLYKSHGAGSLAPAGENTLTLVGANPKTISGKERLELLKKRFLNILEDQVLYEKTSGKQGNPIMRQGTEDKEGGFIIGLEKGGDVETEQEEQSFLSKAASAVSNFIIPKAEALPLPKNFLLGDTPKLVKKTETVKQIAPPEAPLLEKRYNIFDENGNKVYQSKSIDDAQQKALRLGDFEGKEFIVKEIEVPVKVKKAKTTKPGTALVSTIVPENAIGSGNNKLFYSDLNSTINTDTGNLTIKGITVPADSTSMSAKDWHDWFRSKGIKEGELYDSYVRSYLNKKGGFNRETGQFTKDEKISFAEIKELVDTSPSNYIQTVSYSDEAGNLKYGNSGRQDDYIGGSRTERVLWLDSKDIRGDIGSLPSEISRYEGHRNMREVRTSDDFMVQENKLDGEPYVIGWSLGSNRIGKLNNRDIVVNVADEIQSDFLQKAASLKSNIKQEIRRFINQSQNQQIGRNEGLELLYKKLENVFRPMPATYQQLKKSLDQLFASDQMFENISKMDIDDLTKQSFVDLGEAATKRDEALATINASIDNIDARELFPNIPFKDQKDWVDAIIKNDVYNAAKKRFYFDESGALQVNKDAPSHYGVAPAKAIKAYRGGNGVELSPDNVDRSGKMVAYDMQYGGPNLNDHTGTHFTGNVEETLNKIANAKSSKVEVGKVAFGDAGEGVDTFMIELTPDMLFPYKAYKKDGGLVKKSILYTPIVSVNELLSPIGASRW